MSFCLYEKGTQNRTSKPEQIKSRVLAGVGPQRAQNERKLKIFKPRVQAVQALGYGNRLVIFSLLRRDFHYLYKIFFFLFPVSLYLVSVQSFEVYRNKVEGRRFSILYMKFHFFRPWFGGRII